MSFLLKLCILSSSLDVVTLPPPARDARHLVILQHFCSPPGQEKANITRRAFRRGPARPRGVRTWSPSTAKIAQRSSVRRKCGADYIYLYSYARRLILAALVDGWRSVRGVVERSVLQSCAPFLFMALSRPWGGTIEATCLSCRLLIREDGNGSRRLFHSLKLLSRGLLLGWRWEANNEVYRRIYWKILMLLRLHDIARLILILYLLVSIFKTIIDTIFTYSFR